MNSLARALTALAALAFVLAVVVNVTGLVYYVTAEGLSRASANVALLAIAAAACPRTGRATN